MARVFNQIETQLFNWEKRFIEGNENGILVEWKYKSSVEKKTSYAKRSPRTATFALSICLKLKMVEYI